MFKKINVNGLFEIKGKDAREIGCNTIQKLREMFRNDLNISDVKQVIDKNLDKIKESRDGLLEIEKSHGLRNI